ncbi:MAG: hypothetical protein AAF141_07485 [Pseudomonadota bacterium]
MKISTIITTAALGLAVIATPAVAAENVLTPSDAIQAGSVNNFAPQFKKDGKFFVPAHIQRELAERDRRND